MKMTAVLTPDANGGYCALNPETGTVSQGETVEEAVANLREAVELYVEEFPGAQRKGNYAAFVTTFEVADA
jgi:predicted RNase H-like HicB family nuclease